MWICRLPDADERPFIVEMARLSCGLEDRPLPSAEDEEVRTVLPSALDDALVATDASGTPVGAAWWCWHEPPLLVDLDGESLPELVIAVAEGARGKGVGTALIEALSREAAKRYSALGLNVHLRNPAARLYTRTGFRVAARGRGWFGVAMCRDLRPGCEEYPARAPA
jgi:GNAT superfamily N-acetyltransferase